MSGNSSYCFGFSLLMLPSVFQLHIRVDQKTVELFKRFQTFNFFAERAAFLVL